MSDKNLLSTPTDYERKTSTAPSGSGKRNGEPGLPERSNSKGGVDEVTYDNAGGKLPGKGKS